MENYTNLLCFQLKFVIGDYKSFPMKKSQIFNLKKNSNRHRNQFRHKYASIISQEIKIQMI